MWFSWTKWVGSLHLLIARICALVQFLSIFNTVYNSLPVAIFVFLWEKQCIYYNNYVCTYIYWNSAEKFECPWQCERYVCQRHYTFPEHELNMQLVAAGNWYQSGGLFQTLHIYLHLLWAHTSKYNWLSAFLMQIHKQHDNDMHKILKQPQQQILFSFPLWVISDQQSPACDRRQAPTRAYTHHRNFVEILIKLTCKRHKTGAKSKYSTNCTNKSNSSNMHIHTSICAYACMYVIQLRVRLN